MVTTVPLGFSQYLRGVLYANKGLLHAVMVKLATSALIKVEICIVSDFLKGVLTVMDGADGQAIGTNLCPVHKRAACNIVTPMQIAVVHAFAEGRVLHCKDYFCF